MPAPDMITALVVAQDGYNPDPQGGITFESFDPYLELKEIPVPRLAEQQVLIEMSMAAINPSDLHFLKGEYGQPRRRGAAAGFEGVGVVVDSGTDPYALSLIGQRVSFVAPPTGSGTWATHAVSDAMMCIPMPESVNDYDAAGFIVNPLTAAAMFTQVEEAGSPAVVLTAGASQVSKFIIALARDAGVATIPVVRRDVHNEHLRELGATAILDLSSDEFDDRLGSVLHAHKPRFLIDAVTDSISTRIFNAMGAGSTWLIYGSLSPETPPLSEPGHFVFLGKQIRGFWLSPWMTETSLEDKLGVFGEVQARFADGRWHTDVGATVGLTEAMARLPAVLADPGGKVFLRP